MRTHVPTFERMYFATVLLVRSKMKEPLHSLFITILHGIGCAVLYLDHLDSPASRRLLDLQSCVKIFQWSFFFHMIGLVGWGEWALSRPQWLSTLDFTVWRVLPDLIGKPVSDS